jgi:hypothetical protein
MMVNDNPVEDRGSIELTDHEIFHTMFPFIWASMRQNTRG